MELCKYRNAYCTAMPYIKRIAEGLAGRRAVEERFEAAETKEETHKAANAATDWDLDLQDRYGDFKRDTKGNIICIMCAYLYFAENDLPLPDQDELGLTPE